MKDKEIIKNHNKKDQKAHDDNGLDAYKKMLKEQRDFCEKNGIKMVFFAPRQNN